jgi:cold-inducible RNA-binding protein
MSTKVFVGNLNFQTTAEEVAAAFAAAGSVQDVHIPIDRQTGRPRGFAFVEFASESEAAAAIQQFDGYELGGRPLRVNAAEERRGPPRGAPRPHVVEMQGGGGFDRGPREFERDDDFGGGGGRGGGPGGRTKGSRRGLRARKRSL